MFDADRSQIICAQEAPLPEDSATVVSLRDLLLAKEFPYKKGDFEKTDRQLWDRERCLGVGKLVLTAIEQDDKRLPITTRHLSRLALLGQAPDIDRFYDFFDNFTDFKQEVGSPIRYDRHKFADWGITDFVQYAKRTTKELGRLPIIADYSQRFDQGNGPSFAMIESRVGGIRSLHDYLGYPYVKEWDKTDFVDWGVKVMTANPDKDFNLNIIKALAAKKRGPTWSTIYENYGKWSSFRTGVEHEFQIRPVIRQQHELAKLGRYRLMAEQGSMPAKFLTLPDDKLLTAGARYRVVQDCAPDLGVQRRQELSKAPPSNFIRRLRQARPSLTAGHIEMVADSLGVFDDIWQPDESVIHLHVTKAAIDEIRLAKNLYRRTDHHARLAAQ